MSKVLARLLLALGIVLVPAMMQAQKEAAVSVRFILATKFSGHGVSAIVRQTGGPESEYVIAIREAFLNVETMATCLNALTRVIALASGNTEKRVEMKIAESAVLHPAAKDTEAKMLLNRLQAASRQKVKTITGDVRSFKADVKLR